MRPFYNTISIPVGDPLKDVIHKGVFHDPHGLLDEMPNPFPVLQGLGGVLVAAAFCSDYFVFLFFWVRKLLLSFLCGRFVAPGTFYTA